MKSALLVGINDYPGSQNDLHGCVNDITNVYDVLVKYYGFSSAQISLLQDQRATKAAILEGLTKLVGKASPGDVLVFHYSGHGSQVRDEEGDEPADQKDEILCPWDFDWDGTFIKDDDLARIFSTLKKDIHLEVILDSCHSGTGTREFIVDRAAIADMAGRVMDEKSLRSSRFCIRSRYLAPPADIARRADEIFGEPLRLRRVGTLSGINHVLWAACAPEQFSADADIDGRPAGAFTYFFCRHIRDTQGKVTRADLLKRVRASLTHEGFSQIPQLECPDKDKSGEVFA